MNAHLEEIIAKIEGVIAKLGVNPKQAEIAHENAIKAYALRRGSAHVLIWLRGDAEEKGHLHVFAPCAKLVDSPPSEVYRFLLEANLHATQGAAFALYQNQIVVVAQRSTEDLDPSEIEAMVRTVGRLADKYDDLLAERFGLKRASDT